MPMIETAADRNRVRNFIGKNIFHSNARFHTRFCAYAGLTCKRAIDPEPTLSEAMIDLLAQVTKRTTLIAAMLCVPKSLNADVMVMKPAEDRV